MAEAPLKAFVCGHPVAHSRSPLIHGHWLALHGIDGIYERRDVAPHDLAGFLAGLAGAGYAGGNVTVPHKQAAAALVARRDAAAEAIGAVNTLWFEDGALVGGNTDAYGFAAHLDAEAPAWRAARRATVLGAGGAASAIVHALAEAGIAEIRVVNRTAARAAALAARFGEHVGGHGWPALDGLLADSDLLVNTSSLGMTGQPPLAIDLAPLPAAAIVADIVYAPLETALLAAARGRGLVAVDGLGMLLHQAVPGFERWFGVRPTVDAALRDLVVADLEALR
ncbi:shikimate dehydrogenase [Aquibium sp. A9E412]|uniref:shikimate dehydrogenase n=1 Tax=Aquibium sp. A9E412 TaxID=2976767 RepID=UPI0025B10CC0|nr:shikimate dehydrogenase [Aquibium sp. A9E412]MDN2567387.1 shikimate dehydrogenase [Aquibium sp. A9E412]